MLKHIIPIFTFLLFSSCKTNTKVLNKEKVNTFEYELKLFNKGVNAFELYKNIDLDKQIIKIDTSTEIGKERYKCKLEIKEDILYYSIENFRKIIKNYPNSKLYYKSLYNIAYVNRLLENKEDEKKYLLLLLNSNANDRENSGRNGIMADPYANYHNTAVKRLMEFNIEEKKYSEALKYAKLTKKYPYHHFCGNAFAQEKIFMATKLGTIYYGLDNKSKAFEILFSQIFDSGLADNTKLVKLTYSLLIKEHGEEYLKKEWKKSTQKIYKETDKSGYVNFYIKFLEFKIELPDVSILIWDDYNSYNPNMEKVNNAYEKLLKKSLINELINKDNM